MKYRILFSIIILILFNCSLWAEKLQVEYLEGILEAKTGKNWVKLYTDDWVDTGTLVRLSRDSLVELNSGDIRITLVKPGVYDLADILKQTQSADTYGLDSMISMKLKTMISEASEEGQESNMGVRANEASNNFDDDVTAELFELANEEMKKGNYDKAIRLFHNAVDAAATMDPDADSIHMFHYYIGYCYYQKGEDTKALSFLMKIDVDDEIPYYSDYVLLYGKLLMKSFAYNDAVTLFKEYLTKNKNDNTLILQDVYYLISVCYIYLDTIPEALIHLKKVESLDPGSEVGKKAREIIKKLEKST
ncbi:MAG: tetratricopeptide repeat protein [Spirochaetales bacterium]|nr:tetratricopeptide repeat protein [Spirochaetales bacterium]